VYIRVCEEGTDVEVSAGILKCKAVNIAMREGQDGYVTLTVPLEACDIEGRLAYVKGRPKKNI